MVPEFEAACFTNAAGAMVKVKTQFGWHVIAVLEQACSIMHMQAQELSEIVVSVCLEPPNGYLPAKVHDMLPAARWALHRHECCARVLRRRSPPSSA